METNAPHEVPNTAQNSRARQNGRTPKVRASCDHCSNAKVRCDQDRPSCQRCLYVNIPCNYSASRRMGKPSTSARNGNNKSKTTTSARRNSKEDSYSTNNDSYSTNTNSESGDSPKNTTQQLPDTGLDSYGQDFDGQDFDYAASQPWDHANFMSDLSGSLNFASFSNPQANNPRLAQPQLATSQLQATLPNSEQLNFAAPFQNNANPNSNCIRVGAGQSAFQQPSSDLTSSNTISDQTRSITHQSISCVELTSSTLQSLSLPSSMCTSPSQPIPLHTVEQVLAASRGAISAFNTLLQCPCSQSSSFALTLALIISKILSCYSAICRCSTYSPPSDNLQPTSSPATTSGNGRMFPPSKDLPTPSSSSSSSTSLSPIGSSTSMPRGPHNMVLDTPITIGGYKIDPDDEYILILQLVLSELRKVGKLVDAFAVQYSTANPNARGVVSANEAGAINGRSNSGEDAIYKSLEHFLRCQVHKLRREVGAVLRRSEEGA